MLENQTDLFATLMDLKGKADIKQMITCIQRI